jgi:hypothetical protein
MATDTILDLNQELMSVFNKEEMVAFFEFTFSGGDNEVYSGLCKIAHPKKEGGKLTYFSLLFITDVPDSKKWSDMETLMAKIDWNRFARYLPHVDSVLSIPIHKSIKGVYLRETTIYVTNTKPSLKSYLVNDLYPAILKVTGFNAEEPVFWGDQPAGKTAAEMSLSAEIRPEASFLERLKNLFGL